MTVYADEVFLINTLSNALLLYAYAYSSGRMQRHRRMVSAAAAGGFYAALEASLGIPPVLRAAVLPGVVYIAFGRTAIIKHTVRLMLICFVIEGITLTILSAAGAGAALTRGTVIIFASEPVCAAIFICAYPAYIIIMRLRARGRRHIRMRLTYRGRCAEFYALYDSGNLLKYRSKPVIMAAWDAVRDILDCPDYERFCDSAEDFVIYHTISGAGVLPIIEPDICEADGAEINAAVAVVRRKFKGKYSALAGELNRRR